MCILVWILGLVFTLPQILGGSLGRSSGYLCCVSMTRKNIFVILGSDYTPFLISYGIVVYCYWRLFVTLRHHQGQANTNNSIRSQLKEDKSLLRYIGAVAIAPLVLESPLVMTSFIRMWDDNLMPDLIMLFATLFYTSVPLVNPILTFLMVRPVRKEASMMLAKLKNGNQIAPSGQVTNF